MAAVNGFLDLKWAANPAHADETKRDLLEIMGDRYGKASTLIPLREPASPECAED